MEFIAKDVILEHRPDTIMSIRAEYNLDQPGAMANAVSILREWVEKQQHFKKKGLSGNYLETAIIGCKGSIERAKRQIDRMCTLRTLLPQFFGDYNPKTDFKLVFDGVTPVLLPKLTPDHYRVFIVKLNKKVKLINDFMHYFIYNLIVCEYIRNRDYCRGFFIIADFTEVDIMDFLPNLNPVQIRQALTILIEGNGMRVKGIHMFTPSKLIDSVISIMKQVTPQKISERIHSHKNLDELPNIVPLEILPQEYGGHERSLTTILNDWVEVLSTPEFMDYMKQMNQFRTDETYRQPDKFNEDYAGMPGTFRVLSVD